MLLKLGRRGWVSSYLLAVVFRTTIEAFVTSPSAPKAALGDQGETAELQVFGVFCAMPSQPPLPAAEVTQLRTAQCGGRACSFQRSGWYSWRTHQ